METKIEISEFNGHNIFNILSTEEGVYPTRVGFGLKKAQMVLANISQIRAFVENEVGVTPDASKSSEF